MTSKSTTATSVAKWCSKCLTTKDRTEFNRAFTKPDGLQGWCRKCAAFYLRSPSRKAYAKKYGESTRGKAATKKYATSAKGQRVRKANHIKRAYGLSLTRFAALVSEQNGLCKICHTTPSTPLHVDHDHVTGRVRGLLCVSCNRSIAILDNPGLLDSAMQYLKLHQNEDSNGQ